jgi:YidC/Oxa1 family membrane protein insertase
MDKQTIRFLFLAVIVFVGFSLFSKYYQTPQEVVAQKDSLAIHESGHQEIPNMVETAVGNGGETAVHLHKQPSNHSIVTVDTNVLKVKINSQGDLIFAELKKYPQNPKDHTKGFNLLDNDNHRFYVAQTGLLSERGPDSKVHGRAKFTAKHQRYELSDNEQEIVVDLICGLDENIVDTGKDINFIKRFKFSRNSYLVTIEYVIVNNSQTEYKASLYGRLRRLPEAVTKGFFSGGLRTYTGAAISTPNQRYKKISFSDMKEPYNIAFTGGWIAMLEHYFVSAWVPGAGSFSEYQTENFKDGSFGIRFVNSTISVAPGETQKVSAQLFLGPKIANTLKEIAPALDLTVDYGILWWLCVPLFLLLKTIFNVIGNWGWAIILTTLLIKLLFYKLSAASYRSMGNLRKLQPKMEELKARCGEDKQKFSQSVMELYRKEKVNPLGGCLPILVQIPVFIALYYVLLESVELRQASWCLWIVDLSARDPLFILPCLMGVSMFVQQKMNPPPPDPIQAKVLMFMPVFFTALFWQFPSGLMLYWVVNNSLSILQQKFITRQVCNQ